MRKGCRNRWAAAVVLVLAGCVAPRKPAPAPRSQAVPETILAQLRTPVEGEFAVQAIQQAQYVRPPVELLKVPAQPDLPLTESALIEAVLRQNPTLDEMRAAIDAARAKTPQVTSLDDPTAGLSFAPVSLASDRVDPALRLETRRSCHGLANASCAALPPRLKSMQRSAT